MASALPPFIFLNDVNGLQIDYIMDMFIKNAPICFIHFGLQVIFPALDIRVKNVAGTYSLEHKGESDLFSQLFALLQLDVQNDDSLRRELASCTGAIETCLSQHMSKEEEQVGSQYSVPLSISLTTLIMSCRAG